MSLQLHNSLSRSKEIFKPAKAPFVGMYICGPTVYNEVHLGNCRTFVSFDLLYRYLNYLGYKVRYVRNITDVGHLVDDADSGASKIEERARLEKLEPMEIVQKYTNGFHQMMRILNTESPDIEPTATGHIVEQIQMVQEILDNGFAYEQNGSVYFDMKKFLEEEEVYGKLSGKIPDDLFEQTRDDLKNQSEKRHPGDFAIWVKADPSHIMRWPSPWSEGFPGWHLECSVMSTKYLGKTFDIHGGGLDLQFPHHENEIAQNYGACGCAPARYWLHANMLMLNGKKMSKSSGNFVLPADIFTGENDMFSQPYSPMTLRFFMLNAHYRSTLNLTDDALAAAEKGYQRLMEAYQRLQELDSDAAKGKAVSKEDEEILSLLDGAFADLNDDLNTPKALAKVFALVPKINKLHDGQLDIADLQLATLQRLKTDVQHLLFDIMGLKDETLSGGDGEAAELLDAVMNLLLDLRQEARANKDWSTSDAIRDRLAELGLQIKDSKEGATWQKA